MNTRYRLFPALLLPVAMLFPAAAQQSAAQQSEGITRQQADDILGELRQIRQLLQQLNAKSAPQEPPVQRAKLALDGVPMLGAKAAPVTIVEYTDYQCPYCRSFHVSTFPELKKNYIDTGKVRFFSKDMPLDFHPDAMRAAQAARCANEQGKFWQLRDVMGSNPNNLDLEHILGFAGDLKMDKDALRACIQSEKYKNAVQNDVMEAMKNGAGGTPTFVVGPTTTEGVDGELVVGAQPFPVFDGKLKSLAK
jgi:protein-disulfide isomerase